MQEIVWILRRMLALPGGKKITFKIIIMKVCLIFFFSSKDTLAHLIFIGNLQVDTIISVKNEKTEIQRV